VDKTLDLNLKPSSRGPKAPPEQVLDAAAACFMEKGYAGASLDDVARYMGATKGRIYHYFSSKSELMSAVRKHAMDINFAAIRTAYDSDLPPKRKFQAMALAHALNMMEEQAYQRALFDNLHLHLTSGKHPSPAGQMDEFIADRRRFEDMFRDVLALGQAAGEFHVRTLSYAVRTILTTLNSTLYWYSPTHTETILNRRIIADELVEMAMRALGATIDEQGERMPT